MNFELHRLGQVEIWPWRFLFPMAINCEPSTLCQKSFFSEHFRTEFTMKYNSTRSTVVLHALQNKCKTPRSNIADSDRLSQAFFQCCCASLMQIFLTFRIDRNRLATVAHVLDAKEIFWAFLHSCYWLENVNTFPKGVVMIVLNKK